MHELMNKLADNYGDGIFSLVYTDLALCEFL